MSHFDKVFLIELTNLWQGLKKTNNGKNDDKVKFPSKPPKTRDQTKVIFSQKNFSISIFLTLFIYTHAFQPLVTKG